MEHQGLYEDLASYKLHLGQARSFLQDIRAVENRRQKQPIFAPQKPLKWLWNVRTKFLNENLNVYELLNTH